VVLALVVLHVLSRGKDMEEKAEIVWKHSRR